MQNKKETLIKNVLRRVEDFFIPQLCIICNGSLDAGDSWFCASCMKSLCDNHSARDACPKCAQNLRKVECACKYAWDFSFDKVISAYDYDDTVSAIAKEIKYQGKSQLAFHIGFITAPLLPADCMTNIDIIIPVPLHKARQKKRGYNQAEYFARGVLAGLGIKEQNRNGGAILRTDILTRIKNTKTQTKLDKEERMSNLDGAFFVGEVQANELAGKNVMLVDDVFTTGATTQSCAEVLTRAGAASVTVLAMGRRV